MVRLEEREFEELVISSGYDVALPVEVFLYEDERGLEIVSYSFTQKIAREFEKKFASDPFSREARDFLYRWLTPVMDELEYSSKQSAERSFIEFRCGDAKIELHIGCEIISTLDGETWDELPLDEFALDADDPCDRMAVVKVDGKIVCFAGLNDEIDGDGMAEITVECDPAYRGRGFASSCVCALADYLESLGKRVKYICLDTNEASVKTALRAGLVPYCRFMPYVCRKNNPDGTENEELIFDEV
ncbi:MAG: GNAT family N-acetyltransferase [Clostridia bacterium]|nr:GNAT family N-acetyltransferase [Clostridia bacterium]